MVAWSCSGRSASIASISARTAVITSKVLALGSEKRPMKTAVWPEKFTWSS